jgi:hypothetical protein
MAITELMREGGSLGTFHLVYALGLYDYLPLPSAKLLTFKLFDLLTSGGVLLVANFLPDILECGYMETFMRWHLIYRTPDDLRQVCGLLPEEYVASIAIWTEDAGNIAYLRVTRR